MNCVTQDDMITLASDLFGAPHIRAVPIHDDDLASVVRTGGVALIDTADFAPREGYAVLDLGGIKMWRVQTTGEGWLVKTDTPNRPPRHITRRQMNDAWLGVAIHVFSPVA